jgi:DNA repair exonuclease SbcCD ATPase subunit
VFRKNKKPKKSRPEIIDDNYEADLIAQKEALQLQIGLYETRSTKEAADIGFWGMVGAAAIAFDVAILGGVGTGLALGSSALWARYGLRKRRAEKKLKEVEQGLQDYQEMKQRLSPPALEKKPLDTASAKDDFKTAATPETEVELLKKKLADIEKKMEEIQNPKPAKLDKNIFKKPEDKPGS